MKSEKLLEKFLQKYRFRKAIPFIIGDSILDFGGNKGELKKYVNQEYTLCNKDYDVLKNKKFDSIVSLAVIEHIPKEQVFEIIELLKKSLDKNGRIIITTPTPRNKNFLRFLAKIKLLDKENIKEHEHYWNKEELFDLARNSSLNINYYKKFQLGLNQIIVLSLKNK